MSREERDPGRTGRVASGEHERHLAISTVAQQVSQVIGVLTMLVAITILARRLSLPEFGTYGLLLSLTTYVIFIQGTVEAAAIKAVAEATDQSSRDAAFTTALTFYTVAGVAAGGLIVGGGTGLIRLFNIPSALDHQAQVSVLALGVLTAVGSPPKVFLDVLRGSQRFVASAAAEVVAYLAVGAMLVGLALGGGSLWLLVAAGACLPLMTGVAAAAIVLRSRLPYRYRRTALSSRSVRGFLRLSSYFVLLGISDFVIYSLDRAILGSFRPAATVGLYEAPVRAHNLIRQFNATLLTPVLPAAARYRAEGDVQRTRELLLRGTRYTLAAVVPVAIVLMALAGPILNVWLGARFGAATTAMTLLIAYWLGYASLGVGGSMLVAAGRIRQITVYTAAVATLNLGLSLALTPSLGLNGVILGTTVSYFVSFPFFVALILSTFPVRLADLVREVWVPAYSTGALLAVGLVAARLVFHLDTLQEVVGGGVLALLSYWAIYYAAWLRPNERALVKNVALALVRR
jgi:O-antigen/teichoic acid export membrane protein